MKLSTRARYGTRLMLDLAQHYGEGPIYLKDIAQRQDISEKYLGQIIIPLKNAGLVLSTRGAHGGYMLSKRPSMISLKELLEVVEGSLSLVECVEHPEICSKSGSCVNREVWASLSENIIHTLQSITLKDLVEKNKSNEKKDLILYYI